MPALYQMKAQCNVVTPQPAPSPPVIADHKPTLPETIWFLEKNREVYDLADFQFNGVPGTVVTKDDDLQLVVEASSDRWGSWKETITVLENCGVQIDLETRPGTEVKADPYLTSGVLFLNNILPDYEIGADGNRPTITLNTGIDANGQRQPAYCDYSPNGGCAASYEFRPWVINVARSQRALKYIYTDFCTPSSNRPAKAF
jgi:hypothetical protein